MFRIPAYIGNSRCLLYRKKLIDSQLAGVSLFPPNFKYKKATERDTCPPLPPPPKPKPLDDSMFWGSITLLFMAGGFAVYAKRNPEVRDWLTIRAPWFDDIIAVLYEENMSHVEFLRKNYEETKMYISNYFETKPEKCSADGTPLQTTTESKKLSVPKTPKVKAAEGDKPPEDGKEDENPPCEILPPPVITKDICEVEKCVRDLGDTIINNYYTATSAVIYFKYVLDETMFHFTIPALKAMHAATDERKDLQEKSLKNIEEASRELDELIHYLDCGVQAPKESIEKVKEIIKDLQIRIKEAHIKYVWEADKAIAYDSQWQKVEEMIDVYTDQVETMFRGLKYSQSKLVLTGDPDLLLYHAFIYKNMLHGHLRVAAGGMLERINRAWETLPQDEKSKRERNAYVQSAFKKGKAEIDKSIADRAHEQRTSNEKRLKDSLKKQLERHEEVLRVKLEQKEKEATEKLNKMVADQVAYEKGLFAKQLAEMAAKLRIVEEKLESRLKAERETRRSQELWSAGASLLAATKMGDPIVKVDKELKAIQKASGDGDKLVLTVLNAIPDSVRKEGVVPESILREKYQSMEDTAMRVALIEQEGAPLPIFFMSWVQSLLLFIKLSGIPQTEIDKPPSDPITGLDTFDLLQRSRYWVERGNIALALRYISALEGASRAAAATWYEAARSHVETRQAAEAVLAHAAALGLQYL